ncbi:MAG: hypothetical protein IKN55_09740 [Oscillospiraceae bacterium]|nr:hypothetical protein [Oscillospiraceae bacterium]
MKRIVWVGVALLIMVFILGMGLHTLNDIDRKNREYRERREGEAVASRIAIIPETTTVYDRLRTTETVAVTGVVVALPPGAEEVPAPEENGNAEPITPDAPEQNAEQTSTVASGAIVVSP